MIIVYSSDGIVMICVFCNLAFFLKTCQWSLQVLPEPSPGEQLADAAHGSSPAFVSLRFYFCLFGLTSLCLKEKKKIARSVKLRLLFHVYYYFSLEATNKKHFRRLFMSQ